MNSFKKLYSTKWFWLIEHLLFVAIPVTIYMVSPTPLVLYLTMGFSLVYVFWVTWILKIHSFDWRWEVFFKAIKFLLLPTVFISILIIGLKLILPEWFLLKNNFLIWQYVLISVPLQEVLFRGFCLSRCAVTFKSRIFIILFNSFLFASYHLIFGNWYFIAGVFLVNILWSYAYLRYPSIWALILAHAVLGLVYFY